MPKYHDTGTICKAVKRACPLGLSDGDHIEAANEKEFQAKLEERMKSSVRRGNISRATDLCEEAMESSSNIEEISRRLEATPDRERPVVLRKKTASQIGVILQDWQLGVAKLYQGAEIVSNNDAGNGAASDLIAKYPDGRQSLIEAKFGAATNSAPGIKRVSEVLGTEAFSIDDDARKEVAAVYIAEGEKAAISMVAKKLQAYSETFNSTEHTVDSKAVFDLICSSGAKGNSNDDDDYRIYRFGVRNGMGTIKEIPLNLRRDTKWTVKAEPSIQEDSARLNYYLTSEDGSKHIRLTYNNKNSAGLKVGGEIIKIPSKVCAGVGSYNVWYSET